MSRTDTIKAIERALAANEAIAVSQMRNEPSILDRTVEEIKSFDGISPPWRKICEDLGVDADAISEVASERFPIKDANLMAAYFTGFMEGYMARAREEEERDDEA